MSIPSDLRSRKRLAMRQGISNAATRLFLEHGFDHVTVDQIAAAADVGRMTVFNHFPRKEDMFFDRDEALRELLRTALRQRDPATGTGTGPVETLRLLAHRLVAEHSPYVEFSAASQGYIETIEASATLKARVRALRDEIAQVVALALAEAAGQPSTDATAQLAAGLLLATWSVALVQAHQAFRDTRAAANAQSVFLALVDQGSVGLAAALAGSPYA